MTEKRNIGPRLARTIRSEEQRGNVKILMDTGAIIHYVQLFDVTTPREMILDVREGRLVEVNSE